MRMYFLLALIACTSCGDAASAPRVAAPAGVFEGRSDQGVLAFLGIRYGQPPTGERRFRPASPVPNQLGVTMAVEYGPTAPQLADPQEHASTLPQSEDCLFLNVWTPGTRGQRPVVVFIHGGGWVNGGTADPWYYGRNLARSADAVVVSIDYRLGPLGFLDLSEIGGEEYASSGTLGIQDQLLALHWVHENIAAFGGDPENVTLMGQSAGATSVGILMANEEARTLFHKAIVQSGGLNLLRTPETARATTRRFMEIAGVETVEELRALDVEAMMAAEAVLERETVVSDMLFGPVLDGVFVAEPPLHAIARGDAAGIPLLTGTTLDETRYWYFYLPWLDVVGPHAAVAFMPYFDNLLDDAAEEAVIAGYAARNPDAAPGALTMMIATDVIFRQPQIRLAEAHAAHEPRTYMYLFAYRTPVEMGRYGAPHAVDLPFVFDTFGDPSVDAFVGTAPPRGLVRDIGRAIHAFVRTGAPNASRALEWPAYGLSRATMRFDTHSTVVEDPLGEDRAVWADLPFDSVTPAL